MFNDERDFTENHCDLFDSLGDIIANLQPTISAISVRSTLLKCNVRKSRGPDMMGVDDVAITLFNYL